MGGSILNILSLLSFVLAGVVFAYAAYTSTDNPMAFVDFHGALIVFGGSVAATAISFQLDRILLMLKVFWTRTLRGKKPDYVKIIKSLMILAEAYRKGEDMESLVNQQTDLFIQEAMQVLLDGVIEEKEIPRVLKKRVLTTYSRYNADAARFVSMGKYPPAMGLLGAVMGMIALLGGLGKPGAEKGVGPAMSIALVATLYGIALANLVIIPIGENLSETSTEIKTKNLMIVEGVKLIAAKTNPIVLAEELNSFLLPGERIDWKNLN